MDLPAASPLTKKRHYPKSKFQIAAAALKNRHAPLREVARQLGIPKSTASDWGKNEFQQERNGRKAAHPEMEEQLLAFMKESLRQGQSVGNRAIRGKALELAINTKPSITNAQGNIHSILEAESG